MKLSTLNFQPIRLVQGRLSTRKGFTLIELLIVIVIIATLAVTVFVALDPARRLRDARNAKRTSDVETILTAIHAAIVDNKGSVPTNMPPAGTTSQLGTPVLGCATHGTTACGTTAACANLMADVAIDLIPYLASMPSDPQAADAGESGYSVVVNSNGIVTITSCLAEGGQIISASR